MRCETVRQMVEDGMDRPPEVMGHLASCLECEAYVRRWEMVHAGLVVLRQEEPPEPSLGFTTRVMRRLESASTELQFRQQFFDQIGRRVVYATLMVALMLLLTLVLPSSGPFRSSGITDSVLVQAQATMLSNEQILGVDGMDSSDQAYSFSAPVAGGSAGVRGSK